MRVVSGTARGRRLTAPTGAVTRPTADRVREAVFNALGSLDAVAGARVVDLFAGSGAMGIEALSRGASSAVFVDVDRAACAAVAANLDACGFADRSVVRRQDVWVALADPALGPADLVVADPPYAFDRWVELSDAVVGSWLVAESGGPVDLSPRWRIQRQRRYGGTVVTIASATGPPADSQERQK